MSDVHDYIASLQFPDTAHRPFLQNPPPQSDNSTRRTDGAMVLGDSLVSFVSGLGQQAREDVLNSTLLMQLAASKRFDKAKQREKWFNFYTEGLGKLGWTLSHSEMQRYQPNRQAFTLDDVALDIIDSVVGGAEFAPLARRTFESLRKQPHALQLFLDNCNKGNVGTFQIMPCTQNAEGDVTMLMNCMQVIRNTSNTSILFVTFQSNEVQIFRAAQTSVLNTQTYSQVREAVITKLGDNANRFLAHLSL
ncbi:hypothetical protein [Pseudomonas japonica]|uniref:Uncharacterized protein n=1 Tax=Pseudomonas japonica TaxID=256466 RepID=A0A239H023_9PSED|nr:hypothetical protein [Pseudomonas japonica]SNS73634.1 hypothetical protein SAMN05444352_11412 [Pseudomonas japonica]